MAEEAISKIDAIIMLEKHERALGYLYETYAQKFPDFDQFWSELATQERSHAFMIATFRQLIEEGKLKFSARDFKITTINASMQKLSKFLDYARRNEITIDEALEAAMEMELGMVEEGLFKALNDDPAELRRVLDALQSDTQGHYSSVKQLYDEKCGKAS